MKYLKIDKTDACLLLMLLGKLAQGGIIGGFLPEERGKLYALTVRVLSFLGIEEAKCDVHVK